MYDLVVRAAPDGEAFCGLVFYRLGAPYGEFGIDLDNDFVPAENAEKEQ
jgi:hypothetical protein